ncbi:MAG: shikimate dehydrogenase [Candidatus Hadarchaeum sp.]|nr:shikimate dehydrogenase [Candidatus Hadarchaeum sp.]
MTKKTKLFALIGDPIECSLSPAMHNAAFNALGLDCAYIALRVPSEMLTDAVEGIRAIRLSGFNVTHPHKVSIINLLDRLDRSAEMVGAVNVVKNVGGKLIGFNTDGDGAVRALEQRVGKLSGKKVLLLGAGGAARAIALSLACAGAKLTIANRTAPKAKALVVAINKKLGAKAAHVVLKKNILVDEIKRSDILINATSTGMYPDVGKTLVTADMMHRGLIVNDIVYEPLQTKLLRDAKRAGAKTVNGLGMLVHQGAMAFEIWTRKRAPVKVMEATVKRELSRRG